MKKVSILVKLTLVFLNFFQQIDAAEKIPNVTQNDLKIAASFLEQQKSFLDTISPQDCKNLLQVLRCHELIIEHFFAEILARQNDCDCFDFDVQQDKFLQQEKISFDRLTPQLKCFFNIMQDFINNNGSKFDFRTIRLLFEMRVNFLTLLKQYVEQGLSVSEFFRKFFLQVFRKVEKVEFVWNRAEKFLKNVLTNLTNLQNFFYQNMQI